MAHGTPTAPYSAGAPSPPLVGEGRLDLVIRESTVITPSKTPGAVDLTDEQFQVITGGKPMEAWVNHDWAWMSRREAQRILNHIYLGPQAVVRDHAWLKQEGITLVLVVRDASCTLPPLRSLENAAEALGIQGQYINVDIKHGVVARFPDIVRIVNDHVLSMHERRLAHGAPDQGGRVLFCCESGNDRSALLVVAYIMAMYDEDLGRCIQFLMRIRFCCGLGEEHKLPLLSWQEILEARRQTWVSRQGGSRASLAKRDIRQTMDEEEAGMDSNPNSFVLDEERFEARSAFVPFADSDGVDDAAPPE